MTGGSVNPNASPVPFTWDLKDGGEGGGEVGAIADENYNPLTDEHGNPILYDQ
jgi:hypothetical protein